MPVLFEAEVSRIEVRLIRIALFASLLLPQALFTTRAASGAASDDPPHGATVKAAYQAYDASDYSKAAQLLRQATQQNPRDPEIHLLLAKTYYESQQHDAAIASAEQAVSLDPKNSVYHEWLGRVYGEKADHAGMFSALSLAKKARKEFDRAIQLDPKNFSAYQALIEFDCSAPGIAGGGEDKANPEIARLAALDPAEGHYGAGNCRRQKKDFAAADLEFDKALELHPKSPELIFDIGDYAMKHNEPDRLLRVAAEGERAARSDPRSEFYRAVAWVMNNEHPEDCEHSLRDYLKRAPLRNTFPSPWRVHEWLGRLYENQHKTSAAIQEYEIALKLDPKNKTAREALKRLKNENSRLAS
jgi:tetratricopeptide (TPR) repeat protein